MRISLCSHENDYDDYFVWCQFSPTTHLIPPPASSPSTPRLEFHGVEDKKSGMKMILINMSLPSFLSDKTFGDEDSSRHLKITDAFPLLLHSIPFFLFNPSWVMRDIWWVSGLVSLEMIMRKMMTIVGDDRGVREAWVWVLSSSLICHQKDWEEEERERISGKQASRGLERCKLKCHDVVWVSRNVKEEMT